MDPISQSVNFRARPTQTQINRSAAFNDSNPRFSPSCISSGLVIHRLSQLVRRRHHLRIPGPYHHRNTWATRIRLERLAALANVRLHSPTLYSPTGGSRQRMGRRSQLRVRLVGFGLISLHTSSAARPSTTRRTSILFQSTTVRTTVRMTDGGCTSGRLNQPSHHHIILPLSTTCHPTRPPARTTRPQLVQRCVGHALVAVSLLALAACIPSSSSVARVYHSLRHSPWDPHILRFARDLRLPWL